LLWDIEANWQTLTIREKARKISIKLDGRRGPLQIEGEFWHSGQQIKIGAKQIFVRGTACVGLADLALVGGGILIDEGRMTVAPNGGAMLSWPNHRERLWRARDQWIKVKEMRTAAASAQ
jgi:hypothetical protein